MKMLRWDIPESKTRSFKSRPWLEKSVCRVVKLPKGGGMLEMTSEDFEIKPVSPASWNSPEWTSLSTLKIKFTCVFNNQ
jgi:hypothetical protein